MAHRSQNGQNQRTSRALGTSGHSFKNFSLWDESSAIVFWLYAFPSKTQISESGLV